MLDLYLKEIKDMFGLPVLQFPMMQEEIKGMDLLKKAVKVLTQGR